MSSGREEEKPSVVSITVVGEGMERITARSEVVHKDKSTGPSTGPCGTPVM